MNGWMCWAPRTWRDRSIRLNEKLIREFVQPNLWMNERSRTFEWMNEWMNDGVQCARSGAVGVGVQFLLLYARQPNKLQSLYHSHCTFDLFRVWRWRSMRLIVQIACFTSIAERKNGNKLHVGPHVAQAQYCTSTRHICLAFAPNFYRIHLAHCTWITRERWRWRPRHIQFA